MRRRAWFGTKREPAKFWLEALLVVLLVLLAGCRSTKQRRSDAPRDTAMSAKGSDTTPLASAGDSRLQIQLEITDDVKIDRIPMRMARLHFTNLTEQPLRIYLPRSDVFRWGISGIVMRPAQGAPLLIPTPRPHGYVITERDFPLLAPGEKKTFAQTFSLDPMQPGRGATTARRPGFEAGAKVNVRWTYENSIRRWESGVQTLNGPTKPLFGGGEIPHLWTGKLEVETQWTAP